MADQGLRGRVERLLREDLRPDDLTRLFLAIRGQCDGRESVQEIGDFVAHHAERTKGIVTLTTRDWFTIVGFRTWAPGETLDRNKMPPSLPNFLSAMQRRLEHKSIKQFTGLTRVEVGKILPSIIKKLKLNADGTYTIPDDLDRRDMSIINCFISHLVAKPAFTDEQLFQDFSATLKSHGLLKKEEMRAFEKLKSFVALYAVTIMHRCIVKINEHTDNILMATGHIDGNIQVDSAVATANPNILLSTPIFNTDLRTESHCDAVLLSTPQPWDFEIEVTKDLMLTRLA